MLNTEIIVFFSGESFFRLKTVERQRERFDSLKEAFQAEFDEPATDEIFDALLAYQANKIAEKKEKERRKLEKQAAKPVFGGYDTSVGHVSKFDKGRYVLTSAQNNTAVDPIAFAALQSYCEANNARLLIAKLTYNKSGYQQPGVDCEELWYASEVKPYLVEGQIDLGGFHFIADANVIPTARNPISGFEGITPAGIHAIIPASKIGMKVSAALKGAKTKILTSTGTITKRNYILRKAGTVASIEHNIGAVFIDTETGAIRHLEIMEGESGFFDIDRVYYSAKAPKLDVEAVEALQFGDVHAEKLELENLDRAIDMVRNLQPHNIILHDALDFSSRNHHNIKDPVFMHVQHVKGNTVKGDLETLARVLDAFASAAEDVGGIVHIIESNHDLAINTWLKNADFKLDPTNALVYLDCMKAIYAHNESNSGKPFNMLRYAYEEHGGGEYAFDINFHETDESVIIAGVEMGNHGHNGVNGSRGSPVQFRALGIAMNTGHTHAPSIWGRVYTAGVLGSLDMGYNVGASSWAYADIVTYTNGQRQIIFA